MATSSYQTAICFNNEGVAHFEQGNYEQARSMFRKSLEVIKITLAERTNATDASSSSNISGPSVGFAWSRNGPLHADLNLPAPAAPNFIFCRALVIVPPSDDFVPQTDLPQESTAIIYNMALAYMLSGFLTNCSSLLEKGRKFLEIALAIRQRRSESAKLDGERLLDVAICNNLGWINQEFCDFETAQQCFHEVSARLGPLHDSGHLDKQDCEGFIANLVLDAHPNMAAAA